MTTNVPDSNRANLNLSNLLTTGNQLLENIGLSGTLPSSIDLDDQVTSGYYKSNTTTNAPAGVSSGFILHVVAPNNSDTISQTIYTNTNPNKVYIRVGDPSVAGGTGTWGEWREIGTGSGGNDDITTVNINRDLPTVEYITSSSTWTVPANVDKIRVYVYGAGGGGGGNTLNDGSAGQVTSVTYNSTIIKAEPGDGGSRGDYETSRERFNGSASGGDINITGGGGNGGAGSRQITTNIGESGTNGGLAIKRLSVSSGDNLSIVIGSGGAGGNGDGPFYNGVDGIDGYVMIEYYQNTTATKLNVPVGSVFHIDSDTVPAGYLELNGATISRTTYSDLFSVIGTRHGEGDGSTTFQLDDVRGEFIRGWDNGRGVDVDRVLGSFQSDEFKSHNHGIDIGANVGVGSGATGVTTASNGVSFTQSNAIKETGGSETRPRNVAYMAIIKY